MKSNAKMLIIQLTRIGDVIQTYQAALQLKKENPNLELTLLARYEFAYPLEFLLNNVFHKIIYLSDQEMTQLEKRRLDVKTIKSLLPEEKTEEIQSEYYSVVVNLSFSSTSSFIGTIPRTNSRLGIYRNEHNQIYIPDKWSQYTYANVLSNTLNPFNLVDIYSFILGCKVSPITDNYIESTNTDNIVCVHPFASDRKKMFNGNKWTEILYNLLRDQSDIKIFILGATADIAEATNIINSPILRKFSNNIFNNCGKTIQEAFTTLKTSKLLICHDSMVSHLGAVTQTPTIVLSLGMVKPDESSPYQKNVYNLIPKTNCFPCQVDTKCGLYTCHKDIPTQVINFMAQSILNGEDITPDKISRSCSPLHLSKISITRPSFEDNIIRLKSFNENKKNTQDFFKDIYRIIWSFMFQDIEINDPSPIMEKSAIDELIIHKEGVSIIYEIFSFGSSFANKIITEARSPDPSTDKINQLICKLNEIDALLSTSRSTYPKLQPIIDFYIVSKSSVDGSSLIQIAESYVILFQSLNNVCNVIYNFINGICETENNTKKEASI